MKMTFRTINIILFILCFSPVFGQTNVLIPNKGIEGISIVIDSSTIPDVIEIYGTDYTMSEKTLITNYRYDKIGITFQIDPYDKNKIVRSISVQSPFKAKTENGIVLNESTMKDVWNTYNDKGCFTSKTYAWNTQNGISFYIKKDPNEKGYDTEEKIFKIEINNNGDFGISSRINFEFNDEPVKEKLNSLITILKSDNFNFQKLDSFWSAEKITEKEPYGLEKRTSFNRKIENNLTQESSELWLVGSSYNLNIITSSNNQLVYLKLTDNNEHKALFERIENSNFEKTDFDVYTYGTFCGIAGTPPDKCQKMLDLVNGKDFNKLAKWMQSLNPEIATYGYIGLQYLVQNEIDVPESWFTRMSKLNKSEIQLNTCGGCIYGVTEKIKDVLKEDNLKQIYKSFKANGWLK
ncbi:hypothetical protein [Pontimicrobium aquaticum]|uniref:Uncharacterized protein n=1 Tax=Pontimicrobium aquaticum TaxID=2565367 RepID=A0A4U0EJG3_9FLAO|nr:hypothetical protein [Pontimicrobium aquaticum]TJY31587.1 hypothetical protein E5167_15185 [Pontimicrobium aquaticum]